MTHEKDRQGRSAARSRRESGQRGGQRELLAAAPTELQRLIDLLSREHGETLAELIEATGWQAHSVRAPWQAR